MAAYPYGMMDIQQSPSRLYADMNYPADMATQEELWKVCRDTEAYRKGTDTNQHELPDCSSGCKFFHELSGDEGNDWGVCTCSKSPRAGLLTFEHMGCTCWEQDENTDD